MVVVRGAVNILGVDTHVQRDLAPLMFFWIPINSTALLSVSCAQHISKEPCILPIYHHKRTPCIFPTTEFCTFYQPSESGCV